MKKITLKAILIFICSLVLIFGMSNIFGVFAATKTIYVAEVNSVQYQNYEEAWNAVKSGGEITMLDNWTTSGVLTVEENTTVTVNMNGFMINRGLNSSKGSGQVFLVKSNAVLSINGQKDSQTEHKGTIQSNVWHYNDNGIYTIKGALITGGYNSDGGGAIHIQKNAQVNINNVTIAGNVSSDGNGAGAIRLQGDNSVLTISDSEICYNKATGGGGGAIRVEGVDANVQILGTKINNNIVTKSDCDGGAIQINNGTVSIAKSSYRISEISFNSTTRNGGAIYVSNGNLLLHENTIIARNNAGKEGGAVYADSGADVVNIKGIFAGNSAVEEGGAIYVNSIINGNRGVRISNAEFLGNSSGLHGGAIYVDKDDNIYLSGKVITSGNTPNNLYIFKQESILSNDLTEGFRIGIKPEWDENDVRPIKTTNYRYFFCDNMEYEVVGTSDSFYFAKTEMGAPSCITYGQNTYPVTKGTYTYYAVEGGEMTAYYYYSDGYFAESARYYNEHLVTMSNCVAMAAVNSKIRGQYTEEKASKNIVKLFESAGFTNIYIHYPEPEYFGKDSEILSTIGYVIASRDITVGSSTYTLIAVAIRGGEYGAEWASNVTLGEGIGEARGFCDAANQVEQGIYDYIELYELDADDSKYWISGFSRAGAVTNLVSKRLTDKYGENNVYAFCIEAPMGGVFSELKYGLTYANIHCIINASDIVTYVGTAEMGFIRYGVDHILPSYQVGKSEYNDQKDKMLVQLAAINPNIVFNDKFCEASIYYTGNTILGWIGWDLIEEIDGSYDTAAEWNPASIKKLQEYSLTNNVSGSIYNKDSVNWYGYRNYWSTYRWYLYEENGELLIKCYDSAPSDINSGKYTVLTIEDSIANIINFYYSTDSYKKEQIMKALDLDAIMKNIDTNGIYWDIIRKWNGYSIDKKNKEFNELWSATGIEGQVKNVLTTVEIKTLKTSFYVVADFFLDFVGDDYDYSGQNLLGTLIHNALNILQTHYYDVVCAWSRSYDSFYASGDIAAPPLAPTPNIQSGTYNQDINVYLTSNNDSVKIYYTLDGSDPDLSTENYIEHQLAIPIMLSEYANKEITIKAIAVYNGVASEVVTYNYVVTSNARILVEGESVRVINFSGSAYLILAEYDGDVLLDVEYYPVTNNSQIALADSTLNFNNTVMAYVVRDLIGYESFNPLCDAVCITEERESSSEIELNVQNAISIESFEVKQADDPEYIDITFSTLETNAQIFIVALFDKDLQSDFNSVLYFGQIEKSQDNTYSFKIKRSRWLEVINSYSIKDRSLVLVVSANGIPVNDTSESICQEKVYKITYILNGGTNNSLNPNSFTLSDEIVLYNPTREGYDFVGWEKEIPSTETGDIVYTALWEKHVHTEIVDEAVAPTCTSTGLTEGKHCEKCGEIIVAQETVAKTEHDSNSVVTAPDCLNGGYTTYSCRLCDYTYIADEVAALGHNFNDMVTLPTCEEEGYTTHTCSRCLTSYKDAQTSALGHDWDDATTESPKTCKTCGKTEGEKLTTTENPGNNEESWFVILLRAISEFFALLFGFFRKGIN